MDPTFPTPRDAPRTQPSTAQCQTTREDSPPHFLGIAPSVSPPGSLEDTTASIAAEPSVSDENSHARRRGTPDLTGDASPVTSALLLPLISECDTLIGGSALRPKANDRGVLDESSASPSGGVPPGSFRVPSTPSSTLSAHESLYHVSTPSVGYVAPAWGTIFPASALLHVRPAVNGGTTVIALRQNGASCFRIGSDHTQSDLVVATERVAPLHAVLQWRGDSQTTFVYDLGSSAGSLIDEQRLTPHEYHEFSPGQSFCIGGHVFSITVSDGSTLLGTSMQSNGSVGRADNVPHSSSLGADLHDRPAVPTLPSVQTAADSHTVPTSRSKRSFVSSAAVPLSGAGDGSFHPGSSVNPGDTTSDGAAPAASPTTASHRGSVSAPVKRGRPSADAGQPAGAGSDSEDDTAAPASGAAAAPLPPPSAAHAPAASAAPASVRTGASSLPTDLHAFQAPPGWSPPRLSLLRVRTGRYSPVPHTGDAAMPDAEVTAALAAAVASVSGIQDVAPARASATAGTSAYGRRPLPPPPRQSLSRQPSPPQTSLRQLSSSLSSPVSSPQPQPSPVAPEQQRPPSHTGPFTDRASFEAAAPDASAAVPVAGPLTLTAGPSVPTPAPKAGSVPGSALSSAPVPAARTAATTAAARVHCPPPPPPVRRMISRTCSAPSTCVSAVKHGEATASCSGLSTRTRAVEATQQHWQHVAHGAVPPQQEQERQEQQQEEEEKQQQQQQPQQQQQQPQRSRAAEQSSDGHHPIWAAAPGPSDVPNAVPQRAGLDVDLSHGDFIAPRNISLGRRLARRIAFTPPSRLSVTVPHPNLAPGSATVDPFSSPGQLLSYIATTAAAALFTNSRLAPRAADVAFMAVAAASHAAELALERYKLIAEVSYKLGTMAGEALAEMEHRTAAAYTLMPPGPASQVPGAALSSPRRGPRHIIYSPPQNPLNRSNNEAIELLARAPGSGPVPATTHMSAPMPVPALTSAQASTRMSAPVLAFALAPPSAPARACDAMPAAVKAPAPARLSGPMPSGVPAPAVPSSTARALPVPQQQHQQQQQRPLMEHQQQLQELRQQHEVQQRRAQQSIEQQQQEAAATTTAFAAGAAVGTSADSSQLRPVALGSASDTAPSQVSAAATSLSQGVGVPARVSPLSVSQPTVHAFTRAPLLQPASTATSMPAEEEVAGSESEHNGEDALDEAEEEDAYEDEDADEDEEVVDPATERVFPWSARALAAGAEKMRLAQGELTAQEAAENDSPMMGQVVEYMHYRAQYRLWHSAGESYDVATESVDALALCAYRAADAVRHISAAAKRVRENAGATDAAVSIDPSLALAAIDVGEIAVEAMAQAVTIINALINGAAQGHLDFASITNVHNRLCAAVPAALTGALAAAALGEEPQINDSGAEHANDRMRAIEAVSVTAFSFVRATQDAATVTRHLAADAVPALGSLPAHWTNADVDAAGVGGGSARAARLKCLARQQALTRARQDAAALALERAAVAETRDLYDDVVRSGGATESDDPAEDARIKTDAQAFSSCLARMMGKYLRNAAAGAIADVGGMHISAHLVSPQAAYFSPADPIRSPIDLLQRAALKRKQATVDDAQRSIVSSFLVSVRLETELLAAH